MAKILVLQIFHMTTKDKFEEYGRNYADWQIDRSNSFIRKLIKGFYVRHALAEIQGPTIDFGCGAGQILRKLPQGSVGLEVNKALIEAHTQRGLNVQFYDAFLDDFMMSMFSPGEYKSLIISHVLEHFEHADEVMRKLWSGAQRIGVERIVAVVPGRVGFASDETHRTYIDASWIRSHGLDNLSGFKLKNLNYFPVNKESFGDKFIYNEMHLVYSV